MFIQILVGRCQWLSTCLWRPLWPKEVMTSSCRSIEPRKYGTYPTVYSKLTPTIILWDIPFKKSISHLYTWDTLFVSRKVFFYLHVELVDDRLMSPPVSMPVYILHMGPSPHGPPLGPHRRRAPHKRHTTVDIRFLNLLWESLRKTRQNLWAVA